MTASKTTPYSAAVAAAFPDLSFYTLASRYNVERIPEKVFAPLTRAQFATQTNFARRTIAERFVVRTIADLGTEAARPALVAVLASLRPPAPSRPASAPVQAEPNPEDLPFSPSGYYVACGDGCGRVLPAPGPRGVLRFASGHRPKRKRPNPRGAAA